MENTIAQISELFAQFSKDAVLQIEKETRRQEPAPAKHRWNLKNF